MHSGYKSSWGFLGHVLEEGTCSWRVACMLRCSSGVGFIYGFSWAGILLLSCQCCRHIHGVGLTCEQGFLNLMIIQTWRYFRKQSEKRHSEITNTYKPDRAYQTGSLSYMSHSTPSYKKYLLLLLQPPQWMPCSIKSSRLAIRQCGLCSPPKKKKVLNFFLENLLQCLTVLPERRFSPNLWT